MAEIRTLKDKNTGTSVYPITSTKAVFNENGVDMDTLVNQLSNTVIITNEAYKNAEKKDNFIYFLKG